MTKPIATIATDTRTLKSKDFSEPNHELSAAILGPEEVTDIDHPPFQRVTEHRNNNARVADAAVTRVTWGRTIFGQIGLFISADVTVAQLRK